MIGGFFYIFIFLVDFFVVLLYIMIMIMIMNNTTGDQEWKIPKKSMFAKGADIAGLARYETGLGSGSPRSARRVKQGGGMLAVLSGQNQ